MQTFLSNLMDIATTERIGASIAHATAPVFMLSAVAALVNALNGRASRVVDHARAVRNDEDSPERKARILARLKIRYARIRRAMVFALISGALTTLMVLSMFLSAYVGIEHLLGAGVIFFASMALFGVAMVEFVRELLMQHDEFDEILE